MKKFDISNLVISRITDIYSFTIEEETRVRSTTVHSVFIIKKAGKTTYYVGPKKYIADESRIVFLPAGTQYNMFVDEEGDCTVIEFDANAEKESPVPCEYNIDGDSNVADTAKSILHYWNLKGPAYHSKCLAEIYTLITQVSTIHSYTNSLTGKYRMIHKSVKYIESHYARQELYTPDLAKMSGMGETYYRSIFLAVFGIPPAKYIQYYRVNKAKELLVNSKGSIEDIAVAVGFANSSYFCKVFKQTTGMTPSEFAEKGKKLG